MNETKVKAQPECVIKQLLSGIKPKINLSDALAAFHRLDKRLSVADKLEPHYTGVPPPENESKIREGDKITLKCSEKNPDTDCENMHGIYLCEAGDYVAIRACRFDGFRKDEMVLGIAIVSKAKIRHYSRYTPSFKH